MKKTLAISALLSTIGAQRSHSHKHNHGKVVHIDRTAASHDILAGFMLGANIHATQEEGDDCFPDITEIYQHAAKAVGLFEKVDFNDQVAGMREIANMLDVVRNSEDRCRTVDLDWETLDQMSLAWDTPVTFAFGGEHNTMVNGVQMYDYMEAAVKGFEDRNWTMFGENLGHASKNLLEGRRQLKKDATIKHPQPKDQKSGDQKPDDQQTDDQKPKTPEDDPKLLFSMQMGAQFAAGFIYGAGVGGFDEREIFECLKQEPLADQIFVQADKDLKTAIANQDAKLAVRGLSEMFAFIIDMGKEAKEHREKTGHKLCKHLEGAHDFKPSPETKKKKIEEAKMIFKEIINPETTFQLDEKTGEFMFNGQSVSREIDWMSQAYIAQDYKRLGFLLGHAIDKHAWSKDEVMDKIKKNPANQPDDESTDKQPNPKDQSDDLMLF